MIETTDNTVQTNGKWPLPEGWVWTTLGEITQSIDKVQPKDQPDKAFHYLDISGIDNDQNVVADVKTYLGADAPSRARQLVHSGDVLFSTVRTYLRNIAVVPDAYDRQVASTGFSVLRGDVGIQSKYIFYYTLTDKFLDDLSKLQRGTSYPAVRDGDVREQPFPLAPLPEQERIVAEIEKQFTRLDTAVSALKRVQAGLARYKASVLKAAVEGRLVPQDETSEVSETSEVLLARILAERRAQWEAAHPGKKYVEPQGPDTAELGELPAGWVWASFAQVADIASNLVDPTLSPESVHIAPNHIESTTGRLLPFATVAEDGVTSSKHRFYSGQILYSKIRPYLAKAVVIHFDGVCSADMYPIDSYIHAPFLHRYMLTAFFTRLASEQQGRTVLPKINQVALNRLPVPVPPLEQQIRISEEVERVLSVSDACAASASLALARADRLRQAILQKAFRGELVSPDATSRFEPAAPHQTT